MFTLVFRVNPKYTREYAQKGRASFMALHVLYFEVLCVLFEIDKNTRAPTTNLQQDGDIAATRDL